MAVILHRYSTAVMTISTEERDFVEALGVSQQTVQAYKMGKAAHSSIGSAHRGTHACRAFGRVVWRGQPHR